MRSLAQKILKARVQRTFVQEVSSRSAAETVAQSSVLTVRKCPPQRFDFHTTTAVEFPVRRRRRGAKHLDKPDDSQGGSNENPLQHPPVKDTAQFCEASLALLEKLEKALEPMKAQNGTFIIERSRGDIGEIMTIDLGPKKGTYRIETSEEEHLFEYTSPISGKLLYILSAVTGEWVGIEDGHQFEGLLVRDLIRQCKGLPKL